MVTDTEPIRSAALAQSAIATAEADLQEVLIESTPRWSMLDWREFWRFRELLYFLIWRDVKIRYKQTALGAAWAILQPTLTMVVFTLFFGRLAGLEGRTSGVPYPVYVFAGLLPWTFFANTVTNSGNSLVGSSNLITKVYFPRLVIPLAAVGAGLVDFALALIVLMGMMLFYHVPLSPQLLLAPVFFTGVVIAATGIGTLLSALTVSYRDFRYVIPFMVQIWMFITPVIYPSSIIPAAWRPFLALNPLAGLIEGFRSALLAQPLDWIPVAISFTAALAVLVFGASYFRKVEDSFADVI